MEIMPYMLSFYTRMLICLLIFILDSDHNATISKIIHFVVERFPEQHTVWKKPKYGVFSGPYFLVFGLNAGKYGPGKAPYMDTYHALTFS